MLDILSKYVYEVYRCKSVTVAANKLYLSQPALSTAIKKAEAELGAEIFNRKTIPFTLTAEGKIYIEAIEKVMQLEQQTYDRIQDIHEIKSGVLSIAISTNFAYYAVPKICEQFHRKYPNIDINISTDKTAELADMLTKNTADLVFVTDTYHMEEFTVVPIFKENYVIAVRRDCDGIQPLLPYALSYEEVINRNYPDEKKINDMSLFNEVKFIYGVLSRKKRYFKETDVSEISTDSLSQKLNYNLVKCGFGAMLTTDGNISTEIPNDECVYFVLKNPPTSRIFLIAHGKIEGTNEYVIVNEFIKTAKEFFDCENPLKKIL